MSHNRISVVILGNRKSLKTALITNIMGKELTEVHQTKIPDTTEIYENETFIFTCMSNFYIPSDDIQKLFANLDMCLLMVEDGFSPSHVWNQIDQLSQKTGKPTETFTVVLPLSYNPPDYPFNSLTLEQLFRELAYKHLELRCISSADNPESQNQPVSPTFHSMTAGIGPSTLGGQKWMDGKHTCTTMNLVLLGMSGTGKSASGNTILGKKVFMSKPSSNQITRECQVEETEIQGVHVHVIDSPDIFDDDIAPSVKDKHVQRCKQLSESGPRVYVLVMQMSRFTDGERDILTKLEKAFGSKVKEQTVILFTRGDDLYRATVKLEDFLNSCQPGLKEIIQKCGHRCVLFENSRESSDQVEILMETVIRMIQEQQK